MIVIEKHNSLGLLRFVLAFLVYLSHFNGLSQNFLGSFLGSFDLALWAVNCFFVLSGFLMPQSFMYSKSVMAFYLKRFARLYFLYFIVVLAIAFVGYYFANCSLKNYFDLDFVKYLLANLCTLNFLKPEIDCLFQDNVLKVVNGSLWSIKVELMFYAIFPWLFIWVNNKKSEHVLKTIFILLMLSLLVAYSISIAVNSNVTIAMQLTNQLPVKLCYFLAGWLLYQITHQESKGYKVFISVGNGVLLRLALLAIAVTLLLNFGSDTYLMTLTSVLVVFVAYFSKYSSKIDGLLGGLSYPIYLLHFPVIQFYVSVFGVQINVLDFIYVTLMLLSLGWFLYLLESKFLQKLKHLI
jgi:peptidoglycan/LPS O-acetylase OafA/YrhL